MKLELAPDGTLWEPLDPKTIKRKGNGQILRDKGYLGEAAHIRSSTPRPDLTTESWPVPVHFIAAEQDQPVSLAQIKAQHKLLANSTLDTVPESGHMLPLEQPEALAELLSHLIR